MILGEGSRTASTAASLDDLFRRAGVRHPRCARARRPAQPRELHRRFTPHFDLCASRSRHLDVGSKAARTWAANRRYQSAMHLPNTVESVIAFLGVLRAGMIAVPMPLLWRQQEIVAALDHIGAKAIVTTSRIGKTAHAEIAMRAAAELFTIRHVCGFGRDLPDGIVSLDDVFTPGSADASIDLYPAWPGCRPCRGDYFWPRRQWPHAGRAQSCRAGRRRPGNVSGGRRRARYAVAIDDPNRLACRHRPHNPPLALVRWHTAFASRLRSGGIRCAVQRTR